MYTDPVTLVFFDCTLTDEQQVVVGVLDDIFVKMLAHGIISKDDILLLVRVQNSKNGKEERQQEIAQRLYNISQDSCFPETEFDPWRSSFKHWFEIRKYINDNNFWKNCPWFLKIKRGMLTAILRKYRLLKNGNQDPS